VRYGAAWLICALALAMVACAPGVDGMRQSIANTAVAVAAGYKTLGEVDGQVQARIRIQAKVDPKAADAALAEHLKRYDIAARALDAATDAVGVANASVPLVERGLAKDKNAAAWIADLIAVGLRVAAALKELGAL
jgi:hypothetical protein